jgi:hypothetical protein
MSFNEVKSFIECGHTSQISGDEGLGGEGEGASRRENGERTEINPH